MLIRFLCILIGYAFGLIQTGFFIGKLRGIDIRKYGSGNSGTTNMFRTLGTNAGALTFLGDCLKSVAAVLAAMLLFRAAFREHRVLLILYTGGGVILGHNYPFFMQFRGGKGIASTAGMGLIMSRLLFFTGAAVFLTLFLTTHYVSLASLCMYFVIFAEFVIFSCTGVLPVPKQDLLECCILFFLLMVLAFWRHHANIRRLKDGTESKTYLHKGRKES